MRLSSWSVDTLLLHNESVPVSRVWYPDSSRKHLISLSFFNDRWSWDENGGLEPRPNSSSSSSSGDDCPLEVTLEQQLKLLEADDVFRHRQGMSLRELP